MATAPIIAQINIQPPRLRAWRVVNTILCLGLNIVIERLGLNPRWRYLLWSVIAANEIRGIYVVWSVGDALL